jgi:hypothetical protein
MFADIRRKALASFFVDGVRKEEQLVRSLEWLPAIPVDTHGRNRRDVLSRSVDQPVEFHDTTARTCARNVWKFVNVFKLDFQEFPAFHRSIFSIWSATPFAISS